MFLFSLLSIWNLLRLCIVQMHLSLLFRYFFCFVLVCVDLFIELISKATIIYWSAINILEQYTYSRDKSRFYSDLCDLDHGNLHRLSTMTKLITQCKID